MFGLFSGTPKNDHIIVIRNSDGYIQHTLYMPMSSKAVMGITTQCHTRGIDDFGNRFWILPKDVTMTLTGPDGSTYTIPGGYKITYKCD
ncbi:hypothetical protein [Stenotrophomonas phage RAS14]